MISRWIDVNKNSWRSRIIFLAPMVLWGMLWLSLGTSQSNLQNFGTPNISTQFVHSLRSLFPFIAAAAALGIIFFGFRARSSPRVLFAGPMGLAAAYGGVGVIGTAVSPDWPQALYWSLAYLCVPLVLWGLVWRREMVSYLGLLVDYTGVVVALAVVVLFAVALVNFDLGARILDPSRLAECNIDVKGDWGRLTSGLLRGTGVGRYAAIGGIVALAAIWRSDRKAIWGLVLLASLILLIFSGARGAYVGFALAAPFTALALWGKKAVVAAAVLAVVLVPILWSTGLHDTFLDKCVFRRSSEPVPTQTIPAQEAPTKATLVQEAPAQTIPAQDAPTLAIPAQDAQTQTNPTQKAPAQTTLATEAPAQTIPAQGTPTQTIPAQGTPTQTIPAQGAPTQTIPAQGTPTQTIPAQGTPTQTIPAQGAPTQTIPAQGAPTQTIPAQGAPAQTIPARGAAGLPDSTPSAPSVMVQTSESNDPPGEVEPSGKPVLTGQPDDVSSGKLFRFIPKEFFKFTGRTAVWGQGWDLFVESPALGYGFNADRILLDTHMHNAFMHALVQTGTLGTLPFVATMILGWILLGRAMLRLGQFSTVSKSLIIQGGGILIFITFRGFSESSGAFFGIDWLVLAPILFYLQIVNLRQPTVTETERMQALGTTVSESINK